MIIHQRATPRHHFMYGKWVETCSRYKSDVRVTSKPPSAPSIFMDTLPKELDV